MATRSGVLSPRPYARLITMLSNQLIKNNVIALTELAKNSYDADANWVQIRIGNMHSFGKKITSERLKPFVEIEDDGEGMSFATIKNHWMNPASPNKYLKRESVTPRKKRILQGEKGIGRYAVFQIGKRVEIHTRKRQKTGKHGEEIKVVTDLSAYDDDILSKKGGKTNKPLFLDQIDSSYYIKDEPEFIKPEIIKIENRLEKKRNHGTLIRITELNYEWTLQDIQKIRTVLSRLQSPFGKKDFSVSILFNNEEISTFQEYDLQDVFEEALIFISGEVDKNGVCRYLLNNKAGRLNLIKTLREDWVKENRDHFLIDDGDTYRKPECGPFSFNFYLYRPLNTISDRKLADYIRDHRIYIYRDNIRVYPYGDRDNDWIQLDIYRGRVKAGYYLSNDSLIGYVNITKKENRGLRDKTNREGLLEQGTAYDDLRLLTLSVLNFLNVEYRKSISKNPKKRRHERVNSLFLQTEAVDIKVDRLNKYLRKTNDKNGQSYLDDVIEEYHKERGIYRSQIEIVEDLAGVGIAVDATSHDLMLVMNRAIEKADEIRILANTTDIDEDRIRDKIDALTGQLAFMSSLLSGIQPLFRSSRRRRKELDIADILETVKRYYTTPIKKLKADVSINEIRDNLTILAAEGVLLQLFINLMDNSLYWLKVSSTKNPEIKIDINSDEGYVIFADNGPGVKKGDVDYIFEPFFTRKGIQGRGLGLYIARQLTDKYEYNLYYLQKSSDKILPGANFRIDFVEQER